MLLNLITRVIPDKQCMSLVRRNGPVKESVSALLWEGADSGEEQNHSRTGCSAARCYVMYVIAQLQNWCSAITYFRKLVWFWDHVTWTNAFLRRHLHFKKVQKQLEHNAGVLCKVDESKMTLFTFLIHVSCLIVNDSCYSKVNFYIDMQSFSSVTRLTKAVQAIE